jgi:hypothetical protein
METEMLNSYRPKSQMTRALPLCGIIALCSSLPAHAQIDFRWQGDNNNNWQSSGNWSQTPGDISFDISNGTNYTSESNSGGDGTDDLTDAIDNQSQHKRIIHT